MVGVLRELRRRLAERARDTETETPALEGQVRKLKAEIANLTAAIAGGGAGTPQSLVQAVREREDAVVTLEAQMRALRTAPEVISMETRRMEKEARARLAEFRGLLQRNRDGARKVLDALLETPLKFTPTPDNHYVIEGPVYLGGLYPIASDPSGIRTRKRQKTENPSGTRPWPVIPRDHEEIVFLLDASRVVSGGFALQSHGTLTAL